LPQSIRAPTAEDDRARTAGDETRPEELRYLTKFQGLILTLSGRFVNVGSEDLDDGITDALEAIGKFAEVDRSYVFLFSADGRGVSNTHEWCAEGIEPGIDGIQDVPVEVFSWAMPKFKKGKVVHIPDVSRLPADAEKENPDLVLLDIRLRGSMDGVEAAALIRERFGTPIVFVSAYLAEELRDRGAALAGSPYLNKPIDEDALAAAVKSVAKGVAIDG
jgi:CheY-like chemotaxis protein